MLVNEFKTHSIILFDILVKAVLSKISFALKHQKKRWGKEMNRKDEIPCTSLEDSVSPLDSSVVESFLL